MVRKKKSAKLSLGELKVMGILWERGPLTLSEAHELQPGVLGYTTVQTQLNRLVDKGVAARSRSRPMKYRALISPDDAVAELFQILIDSIGRGSIIPLVELLMSRVKLSQDDIRDLKQLIDRAAPKSAKIKLTSKRKKA